MSSQSIKHASRQCRTMGCYITSTLAAVDESLPWWSSCRRCNLQPSGRQEWEAARCTGSPLVSAHRHRLSLASRMCPGCQLTSSCGASWTSLRQCSRVQMQQPLLPLQRQRRLVKMWKMEILQHYYIHRIKQNNNLKIVFQFVSVWLLLSCRIILFQFIFQSHVYIKVNWATHMYLEANRHCRWQPPTRHFEDPLHLVHLLFG